MNESEFRHHPAVTGMLVDLRGDHVGQDLPTVANDGGGSFVTGRFDAEDKHRG